MSNHEYWRLPAWRGHWDPAYWDPNKCEPSRSFSPAIRSSQLTTLAAKLLVVELLDRLDRWLELVLVGAHHHEDTDTPGPCSYPRAGPGYDAETEGTMRRRVRQGTYM